MENYTPLVSVIINCFNGEKFLREAIDSVISQTYIKWELIFWDNQSTDSSAEIVKSYNDNRINYYYAEEHTPLGEARNLAMNKANGEYLTFLDCDDVWMNNYLEVYISKIPSNNYPVLLYSNYYCKNKIEKWLLNPNKGCFSIDSKDFISIYNIAISSAFIQIEYIKENNLLFSSEFTLIEDYDFFLKLCISNKIYYIGEPLMIYRYHNDNLSKKKKFGNEFQILYNKIISGIGFYKGLFQYIHLVRERMNYILANESIHEQNKINAISYITKLNWCSILFVKICIKILIPYKILTLLEKKKYM